MKRSKSGTEFTSLLLEVFRFNGALLAAGDHMTGEFGLSSALWQVLGTIDGRDLPVPHIARDMGLTRQGVQRSVNALFKKGLVELLNNPHHKTAKLVSLSPEGRRRLELIKKKQVAWANVVSEDQTLKDLQTTLETIRHLRETVEGNAP